MATKLYGPENVFDRLMILVSDISAPKIAFSVYKQHDAHKHTIHSFIQQTEIGTQITRPDSIVLFRSFPFMLSAPGRSVANEGHTQN